MEESRYIACRGPLPKLIVAKFLKTGAGFRDEGLVTGYVNVRK